MNQILLVAGSIKRFVGLQQVTIDHTLLVLVKPFLSKRFGVAADMDGVFAFTHDFFPLDILKKLNLLCLATMRIIKDFLGYFASKI